MPVSRAESASAMARSPGNPDAVHGARGHRLADDVAAHGGALAVLGGDGLRHGERGGGQGGGRRHVGDEQCSCSRGPGCAGEREARWDEGDGQSGEDGGDAAPGDDDGHGCSCGGGGSGGTMRPPPGVGGGSTSVADRPSTPGQSLVPPLSARRQDSAGRRRGSRRRSRRGLRTLRPWSGLRAAPSRLVTHDVLPRPARPHARRALPAPGPSPSRVRRHGRPRAGAADLRGRRASRCRRAA